MSLKFLKISVWMLFNFFTSDNFCFWKESKIDLYLPVVNILLSIPYFFINLSKPKLAYINPMDPTIEFSSTYISSPAQAI